MRIKSAITTREYIFTQKELIEKLGMKGNIDNFELWKGLSPLQEERGKSPDSVKWKIQTSEFINNQKDKTPKQKEHKR